MKNEKSGFILLEVVLGIVIVLSALSIYVSNNGSQKKKISVLLEDSESLKWTGLKYGIRMAAQDQNAEVFFAAADGEWTADTLKAMIEEEIADGADAVLTLGLPGEEAADMLEKEGKKIPLELIVTGVTEETAEGSIKTSEPDHFEIGSALGQAVLKDYTGGIEGKKLGILAEDPESEMIIQRNQGLFRSLKGSGAEVTWSSLVNPDIGPDSISDLPAVDLIISLDDESTFTAGSLTAENELHGAICYGIGDSMQSVYYLDSGMLECLIIPDSFRTGYQAVNSVLKIKSADRRENRENPDYYVLYRDTLFDEENQEILLTLTQ